MKKYDKYQPVKALWNMKFPTHWKVYPLCSMAKEKSICNCVELELLSVYLDAGVIPFSKRTEKRTNTTSKDLSKYQRVDPGDFVLNNQQAWRGSVGVSKYTGIISPAYIILSMDNRLTSEFANYLFRSTIMVDQYLIASKGVGSIQRNLYWQELKRASVLVPPIDEQKQIVRYLDWQLSKINHLIHGYQKQINLLKERRQTIIDRAATQGINPNVRYKDSGANWIPQIPEHWNMVYSKKLFAQRKDKAFPNDIQLTSSQKYGIISQDEFMKREGRRLTVVVTGSDILKHVGIGDFVISMRSFQGGLEYSYVEGKISSAYVMLIPNKEKVYDEYFKWLLKSKSYIKALQGTSDLVRDGQALRYANFAKVYLPEIPLEEQKAIADYINSEVARIDNALPTFQKKIELLREYRTRLISDVVTGQIDVRDVVIPEYTPEDDTEIDVVDAPDDTEEVAEDAE